jgi:hypothetical protein
MSRRGRYARRAVRRGGCLGLGCLFFLALPVAALAVAAAILAL